MNRGLNGLKRITLIKTLMSSTLKYGDLTEQIIGCAMAVHRKMGPGYRCLSIEFDRAEVKYKREMEWPVYYDEFIVGKRRVDFFVEDKISVETKAIHELTNKELAQGLNCLESHKIEIGLLINFGVQSLQFKRLINEHRLLRESNPANPNS